MNSLLKIYEKIEGINNDLIRHNQNLEDRLSLVYKSNSWRLTSPLRRSTDLIKRANLTRKKGVKYLIKALLRKLFNRLLVLSGKYPNAKGTALNVMRKVGVYDLVRKLYSKSMFLSDGNLPEHFFSKPITHYNNMSNRAKKIFEDLHDAEVESDKGIK
ncbi:hypothetical protein [Pantoea sp. AV62]|uniref:hypothetical protein n=1 Tax=Pantoea sp. AV62 TaxID=1990688 RepID=UPI000B7C974D|nr:hypothetical protein [Pantoea sp. AV62]